MNDSMMEARNGIRIQSAFFTDDGIEVTFAREEEVTRDVTEMRRRMISYRVCAELIDNILDDLVDLVEEAGAYRRNPPRQFARYADHDEPLDGDDEQ